MLNLRLRAKTRQTVKLHRPSPDTYARGSGE
jgi:hypothetical protein